LLFLSELARCGAHERAGALRRALQIPRARIANSTSEKKSSDFIFGAQIFI
jgi:hypothetical protein